MKEDEEYNIRVGQMLAKARISVHMSQRECAEKIGKSLKTIQNWENGYSTPSIPECLVLFDVLHINPIPYILEVVQGKQLNHSPKTMNEKRKALKIRIDSLTETELDDLSFLLSGKNGSSVYAMLQLFVAYSQSPLINRQMIATLVENNYRIAKEMGTLVCEGDATVDEEALHTAIIKGTESAIGHYYGYVI